jgi:CBS domain-containing protein
MNVKIHDLMVQNVIRAEPHQTVEHVRKMLETNNISAAPVVDGEGHSVGIVSLKDLVADLKDGTPISKVMTEKVYSVPQYDDVHVAARIMRNHHIHHLVVTHEQKVVGILSAFDLLRLVEDRRFVSKPAPTPSKRKGSKRQ